jgi:predicted aspartyl protease
MRRWIWTWILLISYWNLTLGSEQYKSDFSSVKSNVSITLPFEMVSGVMLVQATVNGQQGKYILDTGAPELMVFQEAQPPLDR